MKRLLVPLLAAVTLACVIDHRIGKDAHVYILTPDEDGGIDAGPDAGEVEEVPDAGPVTNSITGSVGGVSFNISEAIALDSTYLNQGVAGDAWVMLSDTPDMCYRLTHGAAAAQSKSLAFYLIATDGFGQLTAAAPGTYLTATTSSPGPNQKLVYASFVQMSAQCQPTEVAPTVGSVTLNTNGVTASGVTDGRFDFTFSNGHLTGSFSAQPCSGAVLNASFCN